MTKRFPINVAAPNSGHYWSLDHEPGPRETQAVASTLNDVHGREFASAGFAFVNA